MLGLNNIQIIGNLGNEPETRQLNGNNSQVVNFSVAVNERWKNREGSPRSGPPGSESSRSTGLGRPARTT